jgi:hypothetical protein
MPFTDRKLELKAKTSVAQTSSQPYVYAKGLMFVLCVVRHSRNNQHYALICSTPLFYILAPTCFGSSLPSSGSFLEPSELHEITIRMCGYMACLPDCPIQDTGHVTTHYMIYHPFNLYLK